mmetsp:Transcript_59505/g.141475  ORF Transcript_59505/g.141475 Transcript_59505/m.141475 type:complete len:374 (+) Transcript_59505:182-1303(+)|eukprot:CAMPEP_0180133098 /NCGR_PEP_ID=MMETSP0986-20121125/9350_1 /TAXON_ID=697907 /ORGANISM="non described non described, Strain CCMP2293" /LENGTH=373 /DNA_ID=CAMNT_0022073175 /DNA_START=180 /DNA_END=1301 /DNA_ORIENTATION=-
MPADLRYAFLVDWLDPQAQLVRQYLLFYYTIDNTVEMDDLKNRRKFLRRCEMPGISLPDLYLGATVSVYSRELLITDYGDDFTKGALQTKMEKTLALIKPDAFLKSGKILDAIARDGFRVGQMRSLKLSQADVEQFYAEHRGKPFYPNLVDFMSSGPIVALELVADGAVQKWRKLIGPTNTFTAQTEAPASLRAQFGSDGTRNACHGSDSHASADRELNFFFGQPARLAGTAKFSACTLALVKPHAVKQGLVGQIVDALIEEGFEVSALQQFSLSRVNAGEFLEVYKAVMSDFTKMEEELSNGPCVAIEVRGEQPVQAVREVVGPHDPELARVLRPKTLRAKYGADKVQNAVHCTDLPEDGQLEVEYFFRIMQ